MRGQANKQRIEIRVLLSLKPQLSLRDHIAFQEMAVNFWSAAVTNFPRIPTMEKDS